MSTTMRATLFTTLILTLLCGAARAQRFDPVQRFNPAQDVGIDQRLGERIPLDLVFRDEHGQSVALAQLFGRRPVVLAFVYYQCPMLCTMVLNDLTRALKALPLELGPDYEVVVVSIDPSETPELAAEKKARYLEQLARAGAEPAAWHFLTGDDASIHALARAAGFRYVYDAEAKQYAHASGLMVVTPQGVLSRYLYGLEYSARDLRLALVEASDGTVGGLTEQVLMLCFHYDPTTGKYGFAIINGVRAAGIATVLALAAFMLIHLRRDARARRAAGAH
jgi:protein SCO1/2